MRKQTLGRLFTSLANSAIPLFAQTQTGYIGGSTAAAPSVNRFVKCILSYAGFYVNLRLKYLRNHTPFRGTREPLLRTRSLFAYGYDRANMFCSKGSTASESLKKSQSVLHRCVLPKIN